ncbi:LamG domain-containing protein [Candidatus Poribacteria bacterium]|nr:LamG domain-containing protein [Candidatus Poribacteria bacterium]
MRRLLLSVCALIVVASVARGIDFDSMVLYVPFEEGAGAKVGDKSATGASGAVTGDLKWVKDGKLGGGIQLVAGSYVEFPDIPQLDITKAITLLGWIYPTEAPGDSNLWGRRNPANAGGYTMQWTAGKVEIWCHFGGWKGTRGIQKETPKLNEWHFVAGVYDGKDVIQYVDGKLDATTPGGGAMDKIPQTFRIGLAQTNLMPIPGKVDEVAVFNKALSLAELDDIRASGIPTLLAVSPGGKSASTWATLKTSR